MARKAGDKRKWVSALTRGDVAGAEAVMRATPGDCLRFMVEEIHWGVPPESLDFVRRRGCEHASADDVLKTMARVTRIAVQMVPVERGPYIGHAEALMERSADGLAERMEGEFGEARAVNTASKIFAALASAGAADAALLWLTFWKDAVGNVRLSKEGVDEVKWEDADCLVQQELRDSGKFSPTPAGMLAILGHPAEAAEAKKTGFGDLSSDELEQWSGMVTNAWNIRDKDARMASLRRSWTAALDALEISASTAPGMKGRVRARV